MAVVKAAKVSGKGFDARDSLATLCYYYPQYTLAAARRLPFRDVQLLLKKARQLEAVRYANLTQIAAAPNSKKGKAVKDLLTKFKDMAK